MVVRACGRRERAPPGERSARRAAGRLPARTKHIPPGRRCNGQAPRIRAIAYSPAVSGWQAHIERGQRRYRDAIDPRPDDDKAARARCERGVGRGRSSAHGRPHRGVVANGSRRRRMRTAASYEGAPKDSWGRPIGAVKARLLAGDAAGAAERRALGARPRRRRPESPVGRYAATLARSRSVRTPRPRRWRSRFRTPAMPFRETSRTPSRRSGPGTRRSMRMGSNASCAPSRNGTPISRTCRSPTPSSSSRSWPSRAASQPARRRPSFPDGRRVLRVRYGTRRSSPAKEA